LGMFRVYHSTAGKIVALVDEAVYVYYCSAGLSIIR
jgi:hypothetical protein